MDIKRFQRIVRLDDETDEEFKARLHKRNHPEETGDDFNPNKSIEILDMSNDRAIGLFNITINRYFDNDDLMQLLDYLTSVRLDWELHHEWSGKQSYYSAKIGSGGAFIIRPISGYAEAITPVAAISKAYLRWWFQL